MRRVKQRQIKSAMQGAGKGEIRRARRSRQPSTQAGKGHGVRGRQPVKQTNFPMTRKERDALPVKRRKTRFERTFGL